MTAIDAGDETETERVMDRADIFRSAHALVVSLAWGEDPPSVYDVLQVARFMEER